MPIMAPAYVLPRTAQAGVLAAALMSVASVAGCAGSGAKPASSALPPSMTLVATPIAPVETSAPEAPSPSGEPSTPPSAPLAPLPAPEVTPAAAAPPPAARVLLADDAPFYPARLRAHDVERPDRPERVEHAHHAREAHEAGETGREARESHESRRRPYHPAPGIVVDVSDAQGPMAAADLQRIARNADYWPFRQCYEDGLRADPRVAGKVSLEIVVNPDGTVGRSTLVASTVHDELVGACVSREARRLVLAGAPPQSTPSAEGPLGNAPFTPGPGQTTAKVDVTLALGDEPVPMGKPFPGADLLRRALRASWDGVRQCYATELATHPAIGGRLELRFRVHRDGDVFEVAEVSDHDQRFGDVDVTRCVLGLYRTAKLPPLPRASRDRSFVYALRLESKPDDGVAP